MIGEREHALLSASSASKWLHCTRSARLEDSLPDSTSSYAEEGTLAHELCALELTKYYTTMSPTDYKRKLAEIKQHEKYSPEMQKCADEYKCYVAEITNSKDVMPVVRIESRVDYSPWAPEGFGTADCLLLSGQDIYVIDYKHGKGVPVSAANNPQMMLYALGAYNLFSAFYDMRTVHMTIFQPRIDNISEFEMPINDLLFWGESKVKPQAERAFKGEGAFEIGPWCNSGFCKAAGQCRARAAFNNVAIDEYQDKDTSLLSLDEIGEALTKARDFVSWLKQLEKLAQEKLLAGESIKGWKLVEGRANRTIPDENYQKLKRLLKKEGFKEAQLYVKQNLGIGALEKLVGKKELAEIASDLIIKPKGRPTLVPESDKRPAIKRTDELFGGIKDEQK